MTIIVPYIDHDKFAKKYQHLGISWLNVPDGWRPLVAKCLIEIEKEMWPTYLPLWLKRFIHYQATGNSVVRIKSFFWNRIRNYFTDSMIIFDIKDKFSTLRIYGIFNEKIHTIIEKCEKECLETCEKCGSKEAVEIQDNGWWTRYCKQCLIQK